MTQFKINPHQLPVSWIGHIFYYFLPIRRKIISDNVNLVFNNTITKKDKKRFIKAFYSHAARTLKETLMLGWYSKERLQHLVEIRNIEYLNAATTQEKGVFLLTGHLGSWELNSSVLSLLPSLERKLHIVRRTLRMKWLERLISKRMAHFGIHRINTKGGLIKVARAIKNKEHILFVMDQHMKTKNKGGIAVSFLGVRAGTYSSLAILARKYNAPIVPVSTFRKLDGKHVIQFHPIITWLDYPNQEQAIYENTLRYNQMLEQMILEHPEQWWWAHRRWKLHLPHKC